MSGTHIIPPLPARCCVQSCREQQPTPFMLHMVKSQRLTFDLQNPVVNDSGVYLPVCLRSRHPCPSIASLSPDADFVLAVTY